MNSIIKNIFLYVANKLGLELADKTYQPNDFFDVNHISVTAAFAERLSTITLTGSKLNVEGTNKRAELIEEVANQIYQDHLKNACTFALGTGSALIKPNTDGERFGFDIVQENDYVITGNIGNYIYAVLIKSSEYETMYSKYTLIESQEIKESNGTKYVEIKYSAFKDDKECPIAETRWKDYKTQIIPNVDRLLFGRIKCPTTNRKGINSPNGVPITFGLGEVVNNSKDSYRQYNQERKDKESYIFANKSIFKKDRQGKPVLPVGKERLFMSTPSRGVDDNNLINIYSPEIRDTSLDNAIERNFRVLELMAGLGEGLLSKSTLTYTNMDEVRAMKQATYSFMDRFRESIDACIEDVLYAVDVIANYNNMTPQGEYKAYIDWSDEYMSSVSERFNQYMQAENAGWIEAAEGRAMLMNEDIDEAREAIEKIKGEEDKTMDESFDNMNPEQKEDGNSPEEDKEEEENAVS